MPYLSNMRNAILLFLILLITACSKPARQGEERMIKTECFSAVDERCYAEMTEYTVLKDTVKMNLLKSTHKVFKLQANRKVKIIKRKIDVALVEYRQGKTRRQVWVAVKNLQ